MSIDQTASTPTRTTYTAPNSASSNTGSTAISSDMQTFLRMLTAQLQNQDPSNPLDSTDFAVQLATFSGVEQQVRTNDLLGNLSSSFGLSDLSKAAGLIGGLVRSPAPTSFEGQPVELYFEVPKSAPSAELVVRNSAGFEISRMAVQPGHSNGIWSGTDDNGDALPTGTYSFAVEVPKPGGEVDSLPVHSYSRVQEAEAVDGKVMLILDNGGRVGFDEISGVRGG